ncbi:acyltransferase family protein [Phyllobacterium sp. K27]
MTLTLDKPIAAAPTNSLLTYSANIQRLRGIAALAVVLYHTAHYFNVVSGVGGYLRIFPEIYGLFGVAIFFAISGYLMAELIHRQPPGEFLIRRIVRIYPTLIVATAIALSFRSAAYLDTWQFRSVTMVPIGPTTYTLAVEWTLISEVFFYGLLFIIAIAGLKRFIPTLAVIWTVLIICNALFASSFISIGKAYIADVPLMLANAGFSSGLLIPELIRRYNNKTIYFCLFAVSVVACLYILPTNFIRVTAGLGSACLVAALLNVRINLPRHLDHFLENLGDWSYSLYLIHVTVILELLKARPPEISHYILFPIAVIAAIAASAILGRLDIYMHNKSKALFRPDRSVVWIVTSCSFIVIYISIALLAYF